MDLHGYSSSLPGEVRSCVRTHSGGHLAPASFRELPETTVCYVWASGSQPWPPIKIPFSTLMPRLKSQWYQFIWSGGRQRSVFLKNPRWFWWRGRAENVQGLKEVCPLLCPGPLVFALLSPHFSCPFLWPGTMMGPLGSQKNSLTLRGHTTKSSQTHRCQTSLLCNFEVQDTAFLECFNNKRSAHTPPTSVDLAPQMYFPEGGKWAQ